MFYILPGNIVIIHIKNKPQINRSYCKCRGKLHEARLTTRRPIRNKDGDRVMLNLHVENQGRIHSFKLSWKNIKHEQFTL
jgi:hypothetical protein